MRRDVRRLAALFSAVSALLVGRAAAAATKATAGAIGAESLVFSSATLTCDKMEYVSSGSYVNALGHAVIVSSGTRLEADSFRIQLSSRTLEAHGHVFLREGSVALLADSATFDGGSSTGVFTNGYFEDPPYRLWARRIVRVSSELYHMEHAAVTSCDEDPPHYHVRMAAMEYVPQKSASAWWPRLALGDDTVLGLPYYHKTFSGKKPWTLTVDPGHSNYHGYYAKSILTYRLTEHGTARAYWDHFSRTGDGLGGEYTYSAPSAQGTVYGYRIEDHAAGSERWNARVAHWQRLSPRLSLQVNGLAQSDSNFNNLYFRDDPNRVTLTAQSNGALSYQHPFFTTRLSVVNNEAFDPARGSFVRQSTVLPELSFQGSPWKVGWNTYLTAAAAVRNQYPDRPLALPPALDPLIAGKDRSRRTGEGSLNLSRTFSLGRRITLEPSAGMSESWQSWRDAGLLRDPHDLTQGRAFTGVTLRHRVTRNLDYDLSHSYRVRWAPDRLTRDHASVDQGMEANQLSLTSTYRLNTASARLSTGYDLRQADGETLITPRRKVTPPALDLNWRPSSRNSFSYREVYALYPVRRPETTQFSWRLNRSRDLQFSSGFSYNSGLPGELQLNHGAVFSLTPGWRVAATVRYLLQGMDGLKFTAVPKDRFEQEYSIRRDLHCWDSRITFRRRPGFTEAYVRIELKTGAETRQEMSSPEEKQYYPGRDEGR